MTCSLICLNPYNRMKMNKQIQNSGQPSIWIRMLVLFPWCHILEATQTNRIQCNDYIGTVLCYHSYKRYIIDDRKWLMMMVIEWCIYNMGSSRNTLVSHHTPSTVERKSGRKLPHPAFNSLDWLFTCLTVYDNNYGWRYIGLLSLPYFVRF